MIDFRSIISSTHNYNFHTHSQFCDGHDTMEAIARSAAAAGFLHLGFSPHSPLAIPSPCNMSRDDVATYRSETERLGRLLAPMQVYCGMEIDYLGPQWGPASGYFRDLGLDFAIGSVHFIPSPTGEYIDIDGPAERFRRNMGLHFRNDIRYVVETFYGQSREMLARGGFDILGHLDKIAHNASDYHPGIEDEDWYREIVDEYLTEIINSAIAVEINTKAYESAGRFFPQPRYWQRLAAAGVPLVVNSDAHHAERITSGRAEAFRLLETLS